MVGFPLMDGNCTGFKIDALQTKVAEFLASRSGEDGRQEHHVEPLGAIRGFVECLQKAAQLSLVEITSPPDRLEILLAHRMLLKVLQCFRKCSEMRFLERPLELHVVKHLIGVQNPIPGDPALNYGQLVSVEEANNITTSGRAADGFLPMCDELFQVVEYHIIQELLFA